MFEFSFADKIETVVLARKSGELGTYVDLSHIQPGMRRVEIDGKCYIVRSTVIGWSISFGPYVCEDASLLECAHMVQDAERRIDPNVALASRNFPINLERN